MKYLFIIGITYFLISLLTINSKNENIFAIGALLIPIAISSIFVFLVLYIKNFPKQKNIEDVLLPQEIENNEQNKSFVGCALVGGMSGIGTNKNQKVLHYLQIKTNDKKEIILKPAFISSNIANLAKNKIIEMVQNKK